MASEGASIVIVEDRDEGSASVEAALERHEHGAALMLCARQHGPAIGRLCMALLGSQADAEDAVQETLLAAHAAFGCSAAKVRCAPGCSASRGGCARDSSERSARAAPAGAAARRRRGRPMRPTPPPSASSRRGRARRWRRFMPSEREALILRYQRRAQLPRDGRAVRHRRGGGAQAGIPGPARLREALDARDGRQEHNDGSPGATG